MKLLILGLVLMLLVAGCTQGQTQQKQEDKMVKDNSGDAMKKNDGKMAAKPSFWIDSPASDALVAPGDVVVSIGVQNFKVGVPETANKDNEGHFHLFLDDGTYMPCADTKCTVKDVPAGDHVIKVVMQQNDHSVYAGVDSHSVKITVKGESDFEIVSPTASEAVPRGNVDVKLSLKNFAIGVPETANKDAEGHFHLYLDSGDYMPCASDTCEVKSVGPGSHTIKVDMRNNDHSLYDDGHVKTVTFTVR